MKYTGRWPQRAPLPRFSKVGNNRFHGASSKELKTWSEKNRSFVLEIWALGPTTLTLVSQRLTASLYSGCIARSFLHASPSANKNFEYKNIFRDSDNSLPFARVATMKLDEYPPTFLFSNFIDRSFFRIYRNSILQQREITFFRTKLLSFATRMFNVLENWIYFYLVRKKNSIRHSYRVFYYLTFGRIRFFLKYYQKNIFYIT